MAQVVSIEDGRPVQAPHTGPYVVTAPDAGGREIVWGLGRTRAEALEDAEHWLMAHRDRSRLALAIRPATVTLCAAVEEWGGTEVDWTVGADGVTRLHGEG